MSSQPGLRVITAKLFAFLLSALAGVQGYPEPPKSGSTCNNGTYGYNTGYGDTWCNAICTLTTYSHGYYVLNNFPLVRDNSTEFLKTPIPNADLSDTGWDLQIGPLMHKNDQGQDSYAYGWLHINLTGSSSARNPQAIIIQAYIEADRSGAAGTFVLTPNKGACGTSDGEFSKAYFVPCTYPVEPLPLTGAIFAKTAEPGKYLGRNYRLNFRINFPWCNVYNSSLGMFFQAYIVGPLNGTVGISLVERRVVYFTSVVSSTPATDPFPRTALQSTITCDALTDMKKPPWIDRVTNTGNRSGTLVSDSAIGIICNNKKKDDGEWVGYPGSPHICQDFPRVMGLPDYHVDYVKAVENATFTCSDSCAKTVMKITLQGEEASTVIGGQVWGARKSHGLMMVFSYFGIYPLTSFMARYYKDDFMGARYVVNVHLWYAVHVIGGFFLVFLAITGGGFAYYGSIYFGRSLSMFGLLHRWVGYVAYICCLLGLLTNGLRCQRRPLRDVTILAHSLTGVLYQFTSFFCILTSVYIPGSPTGSSSIDASGGQIGAGFGAMVPLALLWTSYEVVMNVLVMLHLRRVDSYTFMNPKRTWVMGYIPTPTLGADATRDYKDSIDRVEYLQKFAIVSGIATFIGVLVVSVPTSYDRSLGQMTYTHNETGGLQYPPLFTEYGESAIV